MEFVHYGMWRISFLFLIFLALIYGKIRSKSDFWSMTSVPLMAKVKVFKIDNSPFNIKTFSTGRTYIFFQKNPVELNHPKAGLRSWWLRQQQNCWLHCFVCFVAFDWHTMGYRDSDRSSLSNSISLALSLSLSLSLSFSLSLSLTLFHSFIFLSICRLTFFIFDELFFSMSLSIFSIFLHFYLSTYLYMQSIDLKICMWLYDLSLKRKIKESFRITWP